MWGDIPLHKKCSKCKLVKTSDDFYKSKASKWGLSGYCKPCNSDDELRAYRLAWQRKRRSEDPEYARDTYLRSNYGITLVEFNAMVEDQEGKCAICGAVEDPLHVDHHHATGEIRGLLCGHCNRGLGIFQDSQETLESAAKYLDKYQSRGCSTVGTWFFASERERQEFLSTISPVDPSLYGSQRPRTLRRTLFGGANA